jgi:hypothetical protein
MASSPLSMSAISKSKKNKEVCLFPIPLKLKDCPNLSASFL